MQTLRLSADVHGPACAAEGLPCPGEVWPFAPDSKALECLA